MDIKLEAEVKMVSIIPIYTVTSIQTTGIELHVALKVFLVRVFAAEALAYGYVVTMKTWFR